ncbi:MAG: hypothetical protein OSA97_18985 [Nevskia sp.]|nr:hypothetical protein [Nevskia sp.]
MVFACVAELEEELLPLDEEVPELLELLLPELPLPEPEAPPELLPEPEAVPELLPPDDPPGVVQPLEPPQALSKAMASSRDAARIMCPSLVRYESLRRVWRFHVQGM